MRLCVIFFLLLCVRLDVMALEIEGVDIPQDITVFYGNKLLGLKGAAVRTSYGKVKTYVGALYLEDIKLTEHEIFDRKDLSRKQTFYILSDRISPRRFKKFIVDGLSLNVSEAEFKEMHLRVKKLTDLLGDKFNAGSIIQFEWVPDEKVSIVIIDGTLKGEVAGYDLNSAILKLWIGNNPVSRSLKDSFLGLNN